MMVPRLIISENSIHNKFLLTLDATVFKEFDDLNVLGMTLHAKIDGL